MHKAWAFVVRDYRTESSYKTSFIMRALESLMLLVLFYFLGGLIASGSAASLSKYGDRYLPYVLIGLGFARYFDTTLRMFSESIRTAQVSGCLEAMLSSQTDCLTIVLMSSFYGLIAGAVQLLLILVAGVAIFGVDFGRINLVSTLLVSALSILNFVAFGVLSAATILWLKKGDPITWILGGMGTILGGAYFPVGVMPPWVQKISMLIPITYSLEALRLTILRGYSISGVSGPVVTLGLMTLVLLPVSLFLFNAAVVRGRKEGTLMQY
jgi:ABC-2 type transport system permease protein